MAAAPSIIERARLAALRALGGEKGIEQAQRALTEPIYRSGAFRQGISATELQADPGRLLTDGFKSTQATAARAVAGRVSDLAFRLERRERDGQGGRKWADVPEHYLLDVLEQPNALLSRRQLLKLTSYWLTQTGEAFWLIVTNGLGSTRELWPMSPRNIEKISGKLSPVEAFVFHGQGGETRYGLDEVVWIFDPDPSDPFAGVGVIGPQAIQFDGALFASQTMREHFKNDAAPKIVLQAEGEATAPNPDQRAAFWADWQNRYNRRGGEQLGVPAFLPSGFSAKELGSGMNLDEIRAYLEFQRDGLLMANGVPRSILGDVVDANRAAADTNRLVFDRHTVSPQTGLICDALTHQLARIELGKDWRICFEQFVDEDLEARLAEEKQDLELKVRSINQVLLDRGKDPVEWGELPVGRFGEIPYEPDGDDGDDDSPVIIPGGGKSPKLVDGVSSLDGSEPDDDDDQAADDQAEERGRAVSPRSIPPNIAARLAPEAQFSRLLQAEADFVPRMVRELRRVFATQKAMTLEAAAEAGALGQGAARAWDRSDWVEELFDEGDFSLIFDRLITPISLEVYTKAGENALGDFDIRPSLSFNEAAIEAVRANGADLVTLVNKTTKKKLRTALAKGLKEGEGFEEIASRIRRTFKEASKTRSRTIARTEVGWATTVGQLAGYSDSGVVTLKRWNTALDADVRDSHEIDGQTVREGESFTLGDGEQALGPRVSSTGGRLSARNAINCRCFTTPVLEGV